MLKKLILGLFLLGCGLATRAQSVAFSTDNFSNKTGAFRHMDVAFSMSTVGLGLDVASPLCKSVTLRTGFHFMPKFKPKMSFGVGLDGRTNPDGTMEPVTPGRFEEMVDLFSQITGNTIDDHVDMIGEPTLYNFNLMVDVAPFRDKRWHFTAGVFIGPSQIAKAYNTTEDMPSLFSVNLYNRMYEAAYNDEPLFIAPNGSAVFVDEDIAMKLLENGRMSINMGQYTDGTGNYRLEPDIESMVKVKVKVKPVKPYLGFGFGDSFKYKNRETKYSFAVDAGVMFWGGTPEIITHDGTDLAKDVTNIRGKVGDYVKFMKAFKVCPMVSVKFAKRLF